MPRTKKGSAPPKVYDEMSAALRRRVRKRQLQNGFRDVKGLVEMVNNDRVKQGLPTRSRSYVSEINNHLRKADELRRQHAQWLQELKASPEDFIATAVADIVRQFASIYKLLDCIDDAPAPTTEDEMLRNANIHKTVASAVRTLAGALKDLKSDARIDGVQFRLVVESVAEEVGQKTKESGLSDEIAMDIRSKILGIGDYGKS